MPAAADRAPASALGAPGSAGARDSSLDRMKGVLIVLVVIGHLVSGRVTLSGGNEWYWTLLQVIYLFHMPAFFFVSGLIFALSLHKPRGSVGGQILRRADRLLVPYALMGLAIFFGKYAAQSVMNVDNFRDYGGFAETVSGGLFDLFVDTPNSPSTSIWFLLAYFLCLALAIPLARWKQGAWAMLAVTALAFVAPRVPLFHLDKLADHAVFFALGWIYGCDERISGWIKRHVQPWALALALFLLVVPALEFLQLARVWSLIFGTGASLLILWQMAEARPGLLDLLGRASMIIYVFNTPIIGLVRAAFLQAGAFEQGFVLFLIAATLAAIAIPVLVRQWIVSRSRLLTKYLG
jgi:fucose 4-O-acetylase-like acetyltransferase